MGGPRDGAGAAPSLIVLYGGTFDPVHYGHLAIARAAGRALDSVVRLLPAADPPHRPPPGADAAQRAAMVALAVAGDARLCVDRRELARGGRSYTVDTLRELRREVGQAPLALLLGADSFLGLAGWKEWRALAGLAHFVVAARPGDRLDPLPPPLAAEMEARWAERPEALSEAPSGRVLRLGQPLNAVSATDVRARIAAGRPWRHLVPAAVADHIERLGLYRHGTGAAPPL